MDWVVILLAFGAGAAVTALFMVRSMRRTSKASNAKQTLSSGAEELIEVLAEAGLVLDANGIVTRATSLAMALGLVRDRELEHSELSALALRARQSEKFISEDIELKSGLRGSKLLFVTARAVSLGNGDVLIIVDDKTESHRLEETRQDFVANISHELKTPVGAIGLLAEAISSSTDDPEMIAKMSRNILKESKRLSALVKDVIQLSRVQAGDSPMDFELIDLELVVRDAIDRNSFRAERRSVTIDSVLTSGIRVMGDEEMLAVSVKNIIENAIVYSPESSRVGVTLTKRGDVAEITVTDSGVGISKENQTRIFERFFRTDPARSRQTGGTGLGLSIVKHIIESHLGEISLFSKPGIGSTFTLRLPIADKKLLTEQKKVSDG